MGTDNTAGFVGQGTSHTPARLPKPTVMIEKLRNDLEKAHSSALELEEKLACALLPEEPENTTPKSLEEKDEFIPECPLIRQLRDVEGDIAGLTGIILGLILRLDF